MSVTAIYDRVEPERISEKARQVTFGKTLVRLIATVFFIVGWVTARVFTVVWFVVVWSALAVAEGWQVGRAEAKAAAARRRE